MRISLSGGTGKFTTWYAYIVPLIIFLGVWAIIFSLYFTSPYKYNVISDRGWLYIGMALSSFILGYLFYLFLAMDIEPYKEQTDTRNKYVLINDEKLEKIIWILSSLTLVGLVWKLLILSNYVGGIWEYLKNPIRARYYVTLYTGRIVEGYNVWDTIASYFMNFNLVNNFFGGIFYATSDKRRFLASFSIILSILGSIITFQRYLFLLSIVIWLISALYFGYHLETNKNKICFKRFKMALIIIGIIFIIFVVVLLSLRLNVESEVFDEMSGVTIREIVARSFHSYLVGNIVNFDNFIHRCSKFYYGSSLLRNLFKWFARLGVYEEHSVIGTGYEFSDVGFIELNTYTFMRIFYEDFGAVGLIVLSFLWGVAICWIIELYLKKFSFYRLYLLGLFCHSVLMSFFSFSLLNVIVIFFALSVIWVVNYIYRPKSIIVFDDKSSSDS